MSTTGPGQMGLSADSRPHAYDPLTNPELFDGVLARRLIAFIIDAVVISIPIILAAIFILIFGLLTLGLGWFLFWLWWPAAVVWALVYYGVTLGSPQSATIGMRVMDIQMRTWYGAPWLFRARRRARHPVLADGVAADALHPAGGFLQQPPAAVA